MNALILAAGESDTKNGDLPFCLSETNGKTIIELIIDQIAPLQPAHYIYAFMKNVIECWNLDFIVEQLTPGAKILAMEKPTAGATCTALLGVDHIDNDDELLIVSVNELLRRDLVEVIKEFRNRRLDAGIMCFKSIHPRYAYARLNGDGMVVEVSERKPISQMAMPGIFWFARGSDFVEAAKNIIRKDARVANIFYISSTLNELVLKQAKVGIFPILAEHYLPLKTGKQIEYLETQNYRGA